MSTKSYQDRQKKYCLPQKTGSKKSGVIIQPPQYFTTTVWGNPIPQMRRVSTDPDGISVSEKKFPPSNFEIKSSMNKMTSKLKFLHN
jgi:hypothetical protein